MPSKPPAARALGALPYRATAPSAAIRCTFYLYLPTSLPFPVDCQTGRGHRRYAGHLSAISNFATLPKSGLRHENSRERSPPAGLPGLSQPGLRLVALQYTGERRESDKQKLQKTPAKTPAADTYSTTAFQQKDGLIPYPHNPRARHRQTASAGESQCGEEPAPLRSDDAALVPNCAVCRR